MVNQKTLIILHKKLGLFHFYWGSKNLDKTALKTKNQKFYFYFFDTNLVTTPENFKAEKYQFSNIWFGQITTCQTIVLCDIRSMVVRDSKSQSHELIHSALGHRATMLWSLRVVTFIIFCDTSLSSVGIKFIFLCRLATFELRKKQRWRHWKKRWDHQYGGLV